MMAPGAQLVADWRNSQFWSTQRVAPERQFDRWRDFVNEAHMHWDIRRTRFDGFPAYIRQGRLDGFRMIHLTSEKGGIVGNRGVREIARDTEAVYSFLYVAAGSVRLDFGRQGIELPAGSGALWDTTRPMRFTIGADLRQITLSVPQDRFRAVLGRVDDYLGRRIDPSGGGASRMFVDHLRSLDQCFGDLSPGSARQVLDASVVMLAAALESSLPLPNRRGDHPLLGPICDHVRRHLDDELLDTAGLAAACGISVRQLYRVFDSIHTTPAAWIRAERLKQCRQELLSPASAHRSITDIALRWGFRDSGTFSKIFRRVYGVRPTDLRGSRR